jgi:hypothetical protein
MFMKINYANPSWHEAGHTVVGLHYGFQIDRIDVFEGKFRTMCVLDAVERTNDERYVFLAGGVAGERAGLNNQYDAAGYKDDQEKITARGGASIETYLPTATVIFTANRVCLNQLKSRIANRAVQKVAERMMFGGSNSFGLLSREDIQEIWNACKAGQKQQPRI